MLPRLASILALALPVLAFGCASEPPDEDPIPLPGVGVDAGPSEGEEVRLTVDEPAVSTPWRSVMVTGAGPAGGTLLVDSPLRGQETRSLGSTGEFCIDVQLKDGENLIKFQALSADGDSSADIFKTVTKEGEPPTPEPPPSTSPGIVNRTGGSSYYSNADGSSVGAVSLSQGTWDGMVDGNTSSVVKFEGSYLNNEAVAFKLAERMRVHSFKIHAPAFNDPGCGPQGIDVYVADGPSPEMAFDGINWIKVAGFTSSTAKSGGGVYTLPVDLAGANATNATHVAIMGTNATCGYFGNVYGVQEVVVMAEEPTSAPLEEEPSGAPTCQNRGAE